MKRIISQIFIALLLAIAISAQSEIDKPKLVDEFPYNQIGDLFARLDALGVEVLNNKKSIALIKIYGGTKTRKHFVFPYTWGALMKAYWTGGRNLDAEKIRVQNCNLSEDDFRVEFFLVPQNYNFPKCNDELTVPKETVLFTFRHYENPYIVYDDPYYIAGAEEATSKISNEIRIKLLGCVDI